MDLAIIFISLLLLMFFAYRGFSLIFIAPIFAVLAAITSDYTSMPVYSELYMTKAAEYIKSYYPVFLLGAVFAKIMEEGGLAASVAAKIVSVLGKKRAILAVLLGCGVLTYGGLSVFVVAFVMFLNVFYQQFCGWVFLLIVWYLYQVHLKYKILSQLLYLVQLLGQV